MDVWRKSEEHTKVIPQQIWYSSISKLDLNMQCKIKFFKQGPAYKKEGPDPNKGFNQQ